MSISYLPSLISWYIFHKVDGRHNQLKYRFYVNKCINRFICLHLLTGLLYNSFALTFDSYANLGTKCHRDIHFDHALVFQNGIHCLMTKIAMAAAVICGNLDCHISENMNTWIYHPRNLQSKQRLMRSSLIY